MSELLSVGILAPFLGFFENVVAAFDLSLGAGDAGSEVALLNQTGPGFILIEGKAGCGLLLGGLLLVASGNRQARDGD